MIEILTSALALFGLTYSVGWECKSVDRIELGKQMKQCEHVEILLKDEEGKPRFQLRIENASDVFVRWDDAQT